MRILDLPERDRPRERLLRLGAKALSDRELLAILLGSGRWKCDAIELAAELIRGSQDLQELAVADPEALKRMPGVGSAKAARVAAAFELARRAANPGDVQRVSGSADVARAAAPFLRGLRHERVVMIVCDNGGGIRRVMPLTDGAADESLISVRDVLHAALSTGGTSFAVAHNHPSGSLTPSDADIGATGRLRAAADTVGLRFLGHVIITETAWVSVPCGAARLRHGIDQPAELVHGVAELALAHDRLGLAGLAARFEVADVRNEDALVERFRSARCVLVADALQGLFYR